MRSYAHVYARGPLWATEWIIFRSAAVQAP